MAEHGRIHSKNLRLYAHGSSTVHDDLAAVKAKIKREGFTRGTVTPVNAYFPLDADGNESWSIPLIWEDAGDPRPFNVTPRGAFKWADTMAVY